MCIRDRSLSGNGRAAEEPKDELSTGERMLSEHLFLGQPHVPGKSGSRADCVFLVLPVVRLRRIFPDPRHVEDVPLILSPNKNSSGTNDK